MKNGNTYLDTLVSRPVPVNQNNSQINRQSPQPIDQLKSYTVPKKQANEQLEKIQQTSQQVMAKSPLKLFNKKHQHSNGDFPVYSRRQSEIYDSFSCKNKKYEYGVHKRLTALIWTVLH